MVSNHNNKKTGCLPTDIWENTVSEWAAWVRGIREAELNTTLAFAIICVLVVIVGNVILLISLNFWLSIFPVEEASTNSSQMAVQVIVSCFLCMCFTIVGVTYLVMFGFRPLWRALVDTNRVRGPLYRLLLLFASGSTNALTGVLGVYSMSHTPEFLQAVLLSVIPFCAQVWTYLLVVEERKRRYLSLTLIGSFIFCIAGVLLSSMSSFMDTAETGRAAPWNWALVYLASAVVFGLWCVVQRLYLDAIMIRHHLPVFTTPSSVAVNTTATTTEGGIDTARRYDERRVVSFERDPTQTHLPDTSYNDNDNLEHVGIGENTEIGLSEPLLVSQREWGKQNVDDLAAKTVLLLCGIIFQALVSFALFPVDAIPWFGTSSSVSEAWSGFKKSCDFIFDSWINVRYGMLHTLGFFMSFVGCSYLNERSPTLASVVLQMAGPITGVVLIIVPKWDVYGVHGIVGHKVGGVILLLIAGLFYHVWDQTSLKEMLDQEKERQEEEYNRAQQHQEETTPEVMNVGEKTTCQEV
ncbi:uncharacterized protein TM35_000151340 [Trypanosoma theileri]|uniref:Uncharacterized protein n=1 Tax=Trypanosoma theileri TaxID=67003 RepID=A0A1X0NW47_9TRYP|nr:uncharacterized protein TM35_000151340 [Trypanosoma theileri]ORC88703.1 hypothetical protein TM35_000151340 [Trypanosoma theileri]